MSDSWAWIYTSVWSAFLLTALLLSRRVGSARMTVSRSYLNLILQPWKVTTFLIATTTFTVMAPYTGDPTWDYTISVVMSTLSYWWAPFSVGIYFRAIKGLVRWSTLIFAVALQGFAAAWAYDAYTWWRLGSYPVTWISNLLTSSVIYLLAGLFWNLEYVAGRGVVFSFMMPEWPSAPSSQSVRRLLLPAGVFICIVAGLMLPFLWDGWG